MSARPRRCIVVAAVATAVLVLAEASVAGPIRRSIQIDGRMDDWQVVLLNPPNVLADAAYNDGDPDLQVDGTKDLRAVALTWDSSQLYLYLRRTLKGPGNKKAMLLWYLDLDRDSRLGPIDAILAASFWPDRVDEIGLFRYLPQGPTDPLPGDGQTAPGSGSPIASVAAGAVAVNDVEYEMSVTWAALGLPSGTAIQVRAATRLELSGGTTKLEDAVAALPAGIVDNTAVLDTAFHDFSLSPGTQIAAEGGTFARFPHTLAVHGNVSETIELWASSPDGLRCELWSDPDGDGNPGDGQQLAVDGNGDGDFIDAGDLLAPGADSDGDLRPDLANVPPGSARSIVWMLLLPNPIQMPTDFLLRAHAIAAGDPSLSALETDVARSGRLVVRAPLARSVAPGLVLPLSHSVCNYSNSDVVDLSASSALGWTVEMFVDELPSSSVPLATGQCAVVDLLLHVPSGATPGTSDIVSFTATLRTGNRSDSLSDVIQVNEALTVLPERLDSAVAGTTLFYAHSIVNSSDRTGSFLLSGSSTLGCSISFWTDPDGDGNPADGQPVVLTPPIGAFGGKLPIVVQVDVPASSTPGAVDVLVIAVDRSDAPPLGATVTDRTTIRIVGTFAADYPAAATSIFPGCATVFVAAGGLPSATYRFRWYDSTGQLIRMSAPRTQDGLGLVRDLVVLFASDALGTWRIALETQQGSSWIPVAPGGELEFAVLGDLRPEGGALSELYTDFQNYPLTGAALNLTSRLVNSSPFRFEASRVDYVVFLDSNESGLPDPGESYLLADGSAMPWSAGRYSCRASDLPILVPGGSYTESACQSLGPATFPSPGGWSLAADWRSECGYLIASRTTLFNVGCAGTTPPDAGPDQLLCSGEVVRLGATVARPGYHYRWSPVDFLDDATLAMPLASPLASVSYVLSEIDDGSGCVGQDAVLVLVNQPPPADAGPSVQLCPGASARIGSPATPGFSYSWTPILGLDDPRLAEPLASPGGTTAYTLRVTDLATGCGNESTTVVTVAPSAIADAGPDRSGAGTIGPANCDPGLSYTWTPASGLDDANACNPFANPAASQTYCLAVRDLAAACPGTSDCVVVSVAPCLVVPPAVAALQLVRSGVDVLLSWSSEPLAAGGYHVYRASSRLGLALPPASGTQVLATDPDPGIVSGVDAGAVAPTAGSTLYYRVVAVCADGRTEGP